MALLAQRLSHLQSVCALVGFLYCKMTYKRYPVVGAGIHGLCASSAYDCTYKYIYIYSYDYRASLVKSMLYYHMIMCLLFSGWLMLESYDWFYYLAPFGSCYEQFPCKEAGTASRNHLQQSQKRLLTRITTTHIIISRVQLNCKAIIRQ